MRDAEGDAGGDHLRAAVRAREHRTFAGAIARSHWPASGRAFFRAIGERNGDHRNWPAIEACAGSIAGQLLPAPSQGIAPLRR
jgi:menaquinone-dependent protoporphyrinogen oxidase